MDLIPEGKHRAKLISQEPGLSSGRGIPYLKEGYQVYGYDALAYSYLTEFQIHRGQKPGVVGRDYLIGIRHEKYKDQIFYRVFSVPDPLWFWAERKVA